MKRDTMSRTKRRFGTKTKQAMKDRYVAWQKQQRHE